MTDLRFTVINRAVAGIQPGEVLKVDADDVDGHGRHLAGTERVLLSAAVAGGVLEPLSKAAEAASVTTNAAEQPAAETATRG